MKKMLSLLLALFLALGGLTGFAEDGGLFVGDDPFPTDEAENAAEVTPADLEHLVVGNTTPMRGQFFTEMWGNSTTDIDVRTLLHGYNLVMWNAGMGAFLPDESVVAGIDYLIDEQGNKSYIIALYDDLYWSDGTPITAWDYAFSFLLSIAPEVEGAGGTPLRRNHLLGCEAYLNGEQKYLSGVQVISDSMLMITLDGRYLPFFYELGLIMCNPYPISVIAPGVKVCDDGQGVYLANIDETISEPLFTAELLKKTVLDEQTGYLSHPSVVSGPYVLTSWDGVTAEFEINPWFKGDVNGKMPLIPRLTFTLADNDTMMEKLSAGEFGLLNKVLRADDVLAGWNLMLEKNISMSTYPRTGLSYISFCCERPTVSSQKVRQAIAWCMDRDQVTAQYTGNNGFRVDGYFGMGQWMYRVIMGQQEPPVQAPEDESDPASAAAYEAALEEWAQLSLDGLTPYSVDLDRARALLEEDGWLLNEEGLREKEIDGKTVTLSLKLIYPLGNSVGQWLEAYLVRNLEQVGIRLSLEAVPMNELLSRYYKQDGRSEDMIYLASNFDIVFDPSINFMTDAEGNKNWAYTNASDEELYNFSLSMIHTQPGEILEYCKKWIRFQERFNETLPMLPVYANVYFDFYTGLLRDYDIEANVSWGQAILGAYLSPEEETAEDANEDELLFN